MKALGECFNLTMGQSPQAAPTTNTVKAYHSSKAGLTSVSGIRRIGSSAPLLLESLSQEEIPWLVLGRRLAISTWPESNAALVVALPLCGIKRQQLHTAIISLGRSSLCFENTSRQEQCLVRSTRASLKPYRCWSQMPTSLMLSTHALGT